MPSLNRYTHYILKFVFDSAFIPCVWFILTCHVQIVWCRQIYRMWVSFCCFPSAYYISNGRRQQQQQKRLWWRKNGPFNRSHRSELKIQFFVIEINHYKRWSTKKWYHSTIWMAKNVSALDILGRTCRTFVVIVLVVLFPFLNQF